MSDDSDWVVIAAMVAITAVVVAVIGFGARMIDHHYGVSTCRAYAVQTGRETRFADYTFWTYGCLAKTSEGLWIPTEQLREVAK